MGREAGTGRCGLDTIDPAWFYSSEREKTKLDWFCYEMAMGIYDEVRRDLGRRLRRRGVDDEAVAGLSVHASRVLRRNILRKLSGEVDEMLISYEIVQDHLPRLDDRTVDRVLDSILRAWDEQLSVCEVCPTRCISERDARCTMFDEGLFGDAFDRPPAPGEGGSPDRTEVGRPRSGGPGRRR